MFIKNKYIKEIIGYMRPLFFSIWCGTKHLEAMTPLLTVAMVTQEFAQMRYITYQRDVQPLCYLSIVYKRCPSHENLVI